MLQISRKFKKLRKLNKEFQIRFQNLWYKIKMHKLWINKEKIMQLNFLRIKFLKKNIKENMGYHQVWQELLEWDKDLKLQDSHQKQQLLLWELKKLCYQESKWVISLHLLNKQLVEIYKNLLPKIIISNKKKLKNKGKQDRKLLLQQLQLQGWDS